MSYFRSPGPDIGMCLTPLTGLLKVEMMRPLPDTALVVPASPWAQPPRLGRLAVSLNRGQIRPSDIRLRCSTAARNSDDEGAAARLGPRRPAISRHRGFRQCSRRARARPKRPAAAFPSSRSCSGPIDFPGKVGQRSGLFDSPGRWDLLQDQGRLPRRPLPNPQPTHEGSRHEESRLVEEVLDGRGRRGFRRARVKALAGPIGRAGAASSALQNIEARSFVVAAISKSHPTRSVQGFEEPFIMLNEYVTQRKDDKSTRTPF